MMSSFHCLLKKKKKKKLIKQYLQTCAQMNVIRRVHGFLNQLVSNLVVSLLGQISTGAEDRTGLHCSGIHPPQNHRIPCGFSRLHC